jgi:prepilin-type N-terminal cleavage/methylation domain-containing protein
MRPRTRNGRRGFTLLELVVVIAIVAVVAALAVPLGDRLKERESLRGAARMLVLNLRNARTVAASGQTLTGTDPVTGEPLRARSGGITFLNATQYLVFIDNDGDTGGEQAVRTVDFLAEDPTSRVRIVAPASGQQIRFNSNGTLVQGSNTLIRLSDQVSSSTKEIQVSLTGYAQLR